MTEAWRQHWFPVAFRRDLEPGRVERVVVLGRPLALFLDERGEPAALRDLCPHRSARLSDGRVRAGTVECLYHGWRFDRSGTCVEAPQQPPGTPLPPRSAALPVPLRVSQGLVFAWGGAEGAGGKREPPLVEALDRPGVRSIDFAMELPYGQDAFIENALDVAHIHVAHSGTRGGGHRQLAGPLEVALEHEGEDGFRARFRTLVAEDAPRAPGIKKAEVEFRAPNLVHYRSEFEDASRISGLALYSLPCDASSSRLFYRAYGNRWSRSELARPRWKDHLDQCFLLEEDMAVVRGQVEEIDRAGEPLAELWLPLRSCDALLLQHRSWIERYAPDRPGAVGLHTPGQRGGVSPLGRIDRWSLHTRHCPDCRNAHTRLARRASRMATAAVLAGTAAALASGPVAWAAAAVALGALAGAGRDRRIARSLTLERDPGARRQPALRIDA